jgi:hypothetical protein
VGPYLHVGEVCEQPPQCIAGIIWRPRGKMLEVLKKTSTQSRMEREGKVLLEEDEVIYEINLCSFDVFDLNKKIVCIHIF